ncbi:MAG: hypothetical protein QOE93_2 [Actinomycetota bacterium]|nr:hypothetical protein [Actinomycetota bacterium]
MSDRPAWIALSVSDPAEAELVERGLSSTHLDLAFIELARHLLATGHNLAYGGDLRLRGFTEQLLDLVRSYHLPGAPPAPVAVDDDQGAPADAEASKRIRNYLVAPLYDATAPEQLAAARNVADIRRMEIPREEIPHPVRGDHKAEQALMLSEMRQVVTDESRAGIVLGGKLTGSSGRAPGVLEEAWYSVKDGQPLFVLGGFGGIGSLIADRLAGRDTGDREAKIAADEGFTEMGGRLEGVMPEELPRDGSTMLAEIVAGGIEGLHNGLSVDDNRHLFETDDIDVAIALVLRGLYALE